MNENTSLCSLVVQQSSEALSGEARKLIQQLNADGLRKVNEYMRFISERQEGDEA